MNEKIPDFCGDFFLGNLKMHNKDIKQLEKDLIEQLKGPLIDTNIFLFGEINGKSSVELIADLLTLAQELEDNEIDKPYITLYVNTEGGEIYEMYAIQDTIDHIKKRGIIVQTVGIGQVMSAGLILLACGTKGQRYIGKRTRLMFHEVTNGVSGTFDHIKTEFSETEYLQNQYIESIVALTKKSTTFYKKLLQKKNNQYFTAEQAIEWGLADRYL